MHILLFLELLKKIGTCTFSTMYLLYAYIQQGITDIKVEDTEDGSIIDLVGFT